MKSVRSIFIGLTCLGMATASFAQEDYLTNASAFEASTVCMIPMTVVTGLLMSNPNLAMFFIRQLSIDLGISDERTVNLTQKHIRGRLAESLLFLKIGRAHV